MSVPDESVLRRLKALEREVAQLRRLLSRPARSLHTSKWHLLTGTLSSDLDHGSNSTTTIDGIEYKVYDDSFIGSGKKLASGVKVGCVKKLDGKWYVVVSDTCPVEDS